MDAKVADESQTLSFHGIRVHFRIVFPEGTPRERIMLLASPLISGFHWRKLAPELRQLNCLAVLVDLPGFGRSSCGPSIPQDSITRANLLWGVLDEIDRQTDAPSSVWHLAGHGSACPAVMEMAALYPDSVKSQIHIAPVMSTHFPENAPPPGHWYRDTVAFKDNFRRMIEHCAGYPMDDYIIDRMRAPLLRDGARESFMRMLRAGAHPPACGVGFCPTMALLGGRDPLMTGAARAEIERCLAGAETHVLRSAGHFPMETHSKALRDYLRGWIKYNSEIPEEV